MTTFTLEPQYLFKLASMPRGFNTTVGVANKCNVPSKTIVIDFLGNCLLCDCDAWLPIPVGKVLDFESISEVFASDAAQIIQQDVTDGHFSWCAVDQCGIRNGNRIKQKMTLSINVDESCNLRCPSCRRDSVMLTSGPEYQTKLQMVERIIDWLEIYDDPIHIGMSGNGDPLASHVIRPLLFNFPAKSNQTFSIGTNGLLVKKLYTQISILNQITHWSISIDAGTQSTYEDVRRPGKWSVLLENLDFLRNTGKNSITTLNFVLQNKNFRDLPSFVALCHDYGMRGNIRELDDWGTWSIIRPSEPDTWTIKNGIFDDHDVLQISHPNHFAARELVQQYVGESHVSFSSKIHSVLNS
jgi:molybdenum cofactor biosynthesis enzyme MoaA